MAVFKVEGGHRLKGELIPQGAKNEALQILSAVLLTKETVVINNLPDILDVNKLIDLLIDLGVEVKRIHTDNSHSPGNKADTFGDSLGIRFNSVFGGKSGESSSICQVLWATSMRGL